jgi:hypothetical protein
MVQAEQKHIHTIPVPLNCLPGQGVKAPVDLCSSDGPYRCFLPGFDRFCRPQPPRFCCCLLPRHDMVLLWRHLDPCSAACKYSTSQAGSSRCKDV